MRHKKITVILSLIILSLLVIPGGKAEASASPGEEQKIEVASISFGPVRAIQRKIDELDEKANKHWQGLWEDGDCTSPEDDPINYSCSNFDPGFPTKVLRYWAANPSDQPDGFASAVLAGADEESEADNDSLASKAYSWRYQTGGAISSVAAVNFRDYIYVNSHDGKIYSFLPDGT
ncbi:MAG: hypothetical protein ACLFN5_04325, partial [bacterium]